MTPDIEIEMDEAFKGQFMQPYIEEMDYFEVETDHGVEFLPAALISLPMALGATFNDEDSGGEGKRFAALAQALDDYVEGNNIFEITAKHGFLACLSAPGYMDCTDWSAHKTADEAAQYLIDTYGE